MSSPANVGDADLARLAGRVGALLLAGGRRIATAESCTGGWIGKALTDVPGSSQWFETGYICYGNGAKTTLLGVLPAEIAEHGAVSEPVVKAMALGALERAGADVAVAVSGIAGPDGGSPGKPVGTVWFAWAWRRGRSQHVQSRLKLFKGDREAVRRKTVASALTGVLEL
ncbi:MAG TPA: CinA family protein [Steroidobacteraceae bacterium]|nr:CinA family protein [Steroidobacteraceae bacterium]